MERSRRLYALWNWLVPFRVVAETGNLTEASKSLHVAASALSRSVKLLEERIGRPLFDRSPGQMALNEEGNQLLSSLRTAMRILDDGLTELQRGDYDRALYVSIPGELVVCIMPAIEQLLEDRPELHPVLRELHDSEAISHLRSGRVDVAFVRDEVSDPELAFLSVSPIPRVVCVASHHPQAGGASLDELKFVVATDREGLSTDGFPNHVSRRIGLRVSTGTHVLEVVRQGTMAAVLPDIAAESAGLVALDVDVELPPLRMSVALRPQLTEESPAHMLARGLQAAFAS